MPTDKHPPNDRTEEMNNIDKDHTEPQTPSAEAATEPRIEKLLKNLNRRHFNAFYCHTREEAINKVQSIIPDGSSVTWGGSMTIRDMGLTQALHGRASLRVLDRDLFTDRAEVVRVYHESFSADFYLSSANGVSEDGVIVNIDGNGNRVAAITWGPRNVVFVVGINKIAPTVELALKRARETAGPRNSQRFDIKTPCKNDGQCHNCNSPESICNYVHFLRNSHPSGRHTVVIVGEELGY